MKPIYSGFALIELMIVVAIIGILVAVGIPQYQNYVARSQAAEGFTLAGGPKTAVADYHNTNGVFPDCTPDAHTELGIELATTIVGKYVDGVVVSNDGNGTITATFGSGYHTGKFLRLTPEPTDGAISFNCTTDIEESYRPSGCEEGTSVVTSAICAASAPSIEIVPPVLPIVVSPPPPIVVPPVLPIVGVVNGSAWSSLSDDQKEKHYVCWSQDYYSEGNGEWIVGPNGKDPNNPGQQKELRARADADDPNDPCRAKGKCNCV